MSETQSTLPVLSASVPKPSQPWSARKIAEVCLQIIERTGRFADEVFDDVTAGLEVSDRERSLAFELVLGVLRHYITLDWRLNQVSRKPMARLPLTVATTLRVAAYQLFYLDRIPVSAAVNEAVQLIRTQPGHNWSGFVNGVLRNVLRHPAPSMPDPSVEPVRAFSIRHACPEWLVNRWIQSFGVGYTENLCRQTMEIPPLTVRTNTLRCSRSALLARLKQDGILAEETPVSPSGIILKKCGNPGQLQALQDGWCYVEDEAAQLIPLILDPQPGEHILDACAAPGGKTTHLAQLMNNRGTILAFDRHSERLKRVASNCTRLGISIVHSYQRDWVEVLEASHPLDPSLGDQGVPMSMTQPFDRILVDAPCSGLGILRRHPEGKLSKNPSIIVSSQTHQRKILNRVCKLLRPGGTLVYSACSIEPEETTDLLVEFCQQHPEFQQEAVNPWIPKAGHSLITAKGHLCTGGHSFTMDGFFACRLKKSE